MKRKVDLFLDSGAFSAWTKGEEIDIHEYGRFCKEFHDYIWTYVNLDVIPGKRDQVRTQADVEKSASASHVNQNILKDMGLRPLPVFHMGEDWKWLETMLKEGEDYIGISPFKDIPVQTQRLWLDQAFSILCDGVGRPVVKVHGFGTTAPQLIVRYPWHTVDSTTWTLASSYGEIIMPRQCPRTGEADYLLPALRVVASGIARETSIQKRQAHADAFGEANVAWVAKWIKDKVGANLAELRYNHDLRRRAVLVYYLELERALQGRAFQHGSAGFGHHGTMAHHLSAQNDMPFHIVFATNMSRKWAEIMNSVDARHRLLPYTVLRDHPEWLEPYVLEGTYGDYKHMRPRADWTSERYRNYRAFELLKIAARVEEDDGTRSAARQAWTS